MGRPGHRLTAALLLAPAWCAAAAAADPAAPRWSGEAELGLLRTTGNTDTASLNAKTRLVNERERWRHTAGFDAARTTDRGRTTAERYRLQGKTDYKFSQRSYLFAVAAYEDDRFSGYDYRASLSVGYGRRIVDTATLRLEGEAGAGVRRNQLPDGAREDEVVARGVLRLKWDLSATAAFRQELSVDAGEQITTTRSVTSLSARINKSLAMKLSFTARHDSAVPPGKVKTDTETAVTLVYGF